MMQKPILPVQNPAFSDLSHAQAWADDVFRYLVSLDRWLGQIQVEVRGKVAKSVFSGFTISNVTTTRTMDADTATEPVISDVLGTLIADGSA